MTFVEIMNRLFSLKFLLSYCDYFPVGGGGGGGGMLGHPTVQRLVASVAFCTRAISTHTHVL